MNKDIQLLVVDIDGVLTDGTVEIDQTGTQLSRSICCQDLDALTRWKKTNKPLAVITGGEEKFSKGIVDQFKPTVVRYEAWDKISELESVCQEFGVDIKNTCYIGDADRDAPAVKAAGLGAAPRNATSLCKVSADMVLERAGGEGCIQELVELIQGGVKNNIFSDSCLALAKTGSVIEERLVWAVGLIMPCFDVGGKILVAGNGGSAADAQHFVAELIGRFKKEREPLPAIALTTNTSVLTAVGNDYGFDDIFVRQIKALLNEKDVLFLISTSGESENMLRAADIGCEIGCSVIALTGKGGGQLGGKSTILLDVESNDTPIIQECHITILHKICEMIEQRLI